MDTIDIYKIDRTTGDIVGCHAVNHYRPGPAWKSQVQHYVDAVHQQGFDTQILLPISISGDSAKRTPAQLAYDRAQQPLWQGSDNCAQGTAQESHMPEEADLDLLGVIEPPSDTEDIDQSPTAYDLPLSRSTLAPEDSSVQFPREYHIESSSKPGSYYDVKMLDAHSGICHCKGFSYRRRCSHIETARKLAQSEVASN